MRVVAVVVLLVIVLGVGAWLLGLPPFGERTPPVPPVPPLFSLIEAGDLAAVESAIAAGADVHGRNEAGLTPFMAALAGNASNSLLDVLLAHGADIDQQAANGMTALMLATSQGTPGQVIYLLNAGADPTVVNAEGQNAYDLARANTAVRTSGAYVRLNDLSQQGTFVRGWPAAYVVPVESATISSRSNHLPGAPRAYRNGIHEGFDFYSGTVSVAISYGTPIRAVADGVVVRADHGYVENTQAEYDALIATAKASLDTPPDILDKLRGRQVWIRHAGGFITRYAHLSSVAEAMVVGQTVRQGDIVGGTGNSGTLEAAQGTRDDPHPHVEIWRKDGVYLGAVMEPAQIWALVPQVFGSAAMPPFHD